jgi:Uma2 family endonuclease
MSIAQAKRFTLDEYHKLAELGFFHEERIELINGEIIQKVGKGKPHETSFAKILAGIAKAGWRSSNFAMSSTDCYTT